MKQNYYGLFEIILPKVKNKRVLDVGCVDHDIKFKDSPLWVHSFLKKHAADVLGIDILEKEIKQLKKEGYNVKVGNAEKFDLKQKFDVILAGELIEHLTNQGLFLQRCKKHLKKNGLLILSTPHAFNLREGIQNIIKFQDIPKVNPEHTCYYTPKTITELLSRENFKVEKIKYFDFYGSFLGKLKYHFFDLLGDKFKRRMVIFAKIK